MVVNTSGLSGSGASCARNQAYIEGLVRNSRRPVARSVQRVAQTGSSSKVLASLRLKTPVKGFFSLNVLV